MILMKDIRFILLQHETNIFEMDGRSIVDCLLIDMDSEDVKISHPSPLSNR